MLLELVGAALLVGGSALVLWVVVSTDAPWEGATRPQSVAPAVEPSLRRAA